MTGASDYFSVGEHAFSMILSGTAFGAAWLIRIVSLIVGLGAAVFLVRKPTFALVTATIAGGIALSTLAWGGHGAMDEGGKGVLHLSSDILHLIAAGGWVGALAAFVLLLRVDHSAPNERIQLLSRTLASFAAVGSMIVLALIATGLINYGMIVGPTLSGLLTTSYGQLLLVKLAVFGLMLALAAANRFHLTPLLEASIRRGDHQGAILALRKSLFVESGAATAILALVAALGTLSPQ
ncbi:copper homeostasis membrane protein CopD, partial [Burkholderia diffusa]